MDEGGPLTYKLEGMARRASGVWRMNRGARLMPEFGARNRTEGTMFQFTVTYQVESFVKT